MGWGGAGGGTGVTGFEQIQILAVVWGGGEVAARTREMMEPAEISRGLGEG